jgi:hypothetical protein
MDLAAWFGPQGVLSSGDPAHIFGSGPVMQRSTLSIDELRRRIKERTLIDEDAIDEMVELQLKLFADEIAEWNEHDWWLYVMKGNWAGQHDLLLVS